MHTTRILIGLGAALSMSALGCNEDGTNGSDSPPPDNQPVVMTLGYPAGPYNVQPGDVIADFAFLGVPNPAKGATLGPIKLSDFYNPHADDPSYMPANASVDDRLYPAGSPYGPGTKKPRALAVNIGAVWCGPCNFEAKTELPSHYAKYHPLGGEFLFQLADGATQGTAATQKDLASWTKKYKVDYPSTIDADKQLTAFFDANAYPANMIIDLRTMRIVAVVAGVPDEAYWGKFEATIANK
ncbi:MAG: hypothetical protein ABJE95_16590 [Byssovorax sp.]